MNDVLDDVPGENPLSIESVLGFKFHGTNVRVPGSIPGFSTNVRF